MTGYVCAECHTDLENTGKKAMIYVVEVPVWYCPRCDIEFDATDYDRSISKSELYDRKVNDLLDNAYEFIWGGGWDGSDSTRAQKWIQEYKKLRGIE